MTYSNHIFKAFSDFDVDEIPLQADVSRRMVARLKDIDNPATSGPATPAAQAALASSVVAHAVVELEMRFLELKKGS